MLILTASIKRLLCYFKDRKPFILIQTLGFEKYKYDDNWLTIYANENPSIKCIITTTDGIYYHFFTDFKEEGLGRICVTLSLNTREKPFDFSKTEEAEKAILIKEILDLKILQE
ncbi:hypothetical protein CQA76_01765 [Campylobacter aviculae]|uniref:Uncharacterized protein n=1 Tax=Campylobacter aviculae TaxID=2510190 RepID=A0A4U7BW10_9BACT|nr:hypothetical protein CQA76_01765 [Campylobacter aviculae]